MGGQLGIVNAIVGLAAAIVVLYLFLRDIVSGRRWAILILGSFLILVAVVVFVYKPIVPVESVTTISADAGRQRVKNNIVEREYIIDIVNDTHRGFSSSSGRFTKEFATIPGHKIVDYEWIPTSVNNEKEFRVLLGHDGTKIAIEVTLEAGPIYDRWRGWAKGRLITKQSSD